MRKDGEKLQLKNEQYCRKTVDTKFNNFKSNKIIYQPENIELKHENISQVYNEIKVIQS